MDKMHLEELLEKLEIAQEKKDNSFFDYFKTITTVYTGLIGLLIGLKATPIPNNDAKVSFFISIILVGLCIFFSLLTQFYKVAIYKQEIEVRKKQILNFIGDPKQNNFQIDDLNKHWFYDFTEITTFILMFLSITAITTYVYFLEYPIFSF